MSEDRHVYRLEMAVPDLTRPPSHPGAGGVAVRCLGKGGRCPQVLGVVAGGYLYTRHEGREITGKVPQWVKCERCGCRQKIGG